MSASTSAADKASALEGSAAPATVGQPAAPDMTDDERRRRIAEAAYYRAERRNFAPGQEQDDWLEAEKQFSDTERGA